MLVFVRSSAKFLRDSHDCELVKGLNETQSNDNLHKVVILSVVMKLYTILIIIVALLSCSSLYSQDMKDLEKLVETEKAFADMARKKSVEQLLNLG